MPQLVLSSGYTWGFGLQQIEGESVFKNIFRVVTSFEKEICESVCERERERDAIQKHLGYDVETK